MKGFLSEDLQKCFRVSSQQVSVLCQGLVLAESDAWEAEAAEVKHPEQLASHSR